MEEEKKLPEPTPGVEQMPVMETERDPLLDASPEKQLIYRLFVGKPNGGKNAPEGMTRREKETVMYRDMLKWVIAIIIIYIVLRIVL